MKDQRLKIGIVFNIDRIWMGGVIYIINLIRILDFLDEDEKPEITLFYRSDLKEFVDQIKYPNLEVVEWSFPSVYQGYLKSWVTSKNHFISEILANYDLDGLYPLNDFPVKTSSKTKLVCWVPDLQHKYYPEFFSKKKLLERAFRHKLMLKNSEYLVSSSEAVKKDMTKFFKLREEMKIPVFHFASVIEDFSDLDIIILRKKYQLPEKFFMVSNQFYKHKNHIVIFKALIRLNSIGYNIHIANTGRFPDASYSPYMKELHSLIDNNGLQDQISFLGNIPRNEQLMLMKHSQAVLQPSLFEGWSTVIEDAISLQVPVIASSLEVNIEQLGPDGNYFDPHDEEKLAKILMDCPERDIEGIYYQDYQDRVKSAARVFTDIFKD